VINFVSSEAICSISEGWVYVTAAWSLPGIDLLLLSFRLLGKHSWETRSTGIAISNTIWLQKPQVHYYAGFFFELRTEINAAIVKTAKKWSLKLRAKKDMWYEGPQEIGIRLALESTRDIKIEAGRRYLTAQRLGENQCTKPLDSNFVLVECGIMDLSSDYFPWLKSVANTQISKEWPNTP